MLSEKKLDSSSGFGFYPKKSVEEAVKSQPKSDYVTPIERRLHFTAAYHHLINGCPLLTLDVLSKLPRYVSSMPPVFSESKETLPVQEEVAAKKADEKAGFFDWSTPSYDSTFASKRFDDDELELDLKMSSDEDDDSSKSEISEEEVKVSKEAPIEKPEEKVEMATDDREKTVDMFAQQIKFISCLKILIEELSTLATGFEVAGGQLRYYLFYWLEKETHILRKLGDYDYNNGYHSYGSLLSRDESMNETSEEIDSSRTGSLFHEQVIEEQKVFQSKVSRLNKRKEWLRSNELLLRTFLSYCSLHNSKGGMTILFK